MTGVRRSDIRRVNGITISLSATEATGFSPVGRLTDQIIDGLREREAVIDIVEDIKRGEGSKNGLGCCGDTALDKRVHCDGICDRSRDRDGGLVSDTLGGYANPGHRGPINRACPTNLTALPPVQEKF